MHTRSVARLALAAALLSMAFAAGLGAQTATPLPTRRPVAQVNLKANEPYYLDTFKGDIERLESGLNSMSSQAIKLGSKDRLNILIDSIDQMLFRQYCDREGIKVSDGDVANQLNQYRSSLGPGASDAMVEASLRRNGVFTDVKSYIRQDLLFSSYLRARKSDDLKSIGSPSSAEVLKAYDDMKFNLHRPTFYRFTMLSVSTQGKSDAEKKKARDTMRAMADKIKVNANVFDEYLVKGAVDPKSAGFQTILGLVMPKTAESKKQYPALYDAIFSLKEGEVSDLVEESNGLVIARAGALFPEKLLGFDDQIEGLPGKASQANPAATVLALVINDIQTSRYSDLQKKTRDEINAKLRKEATITISLANLAGILDDPEIAALKALKGQGYNVVIQ